MDVRSTRYQFCAKRVLTHSSANARSRQVRAPDVYGNPLVEYLAPSQLRGADVVGSVPALRLRNIEFLACSIPAEFSTRSDSFARRRLG